MPKDKLAQVFHFDLYGKRESKYDFLNENSLKSIDWNELQPVEPNFFLVKKDFENGKEFSNFIDFKKLFLIQSMGIATGNDDNLVFFSKKEIAQYFEEPSKFYYRPFDTRYTIFDNTILQRARFKLMQNYIKKENIGINIVRQSKCRGVEVLVSNILSNRDLITNHTYNLPLYLYPETTAQQSIYQSNERTPNLNAEIVKQIAEGLGLKFTNEKETTNGTFAPIDILDYIYAVLHSPAYREKYKEFLKIDFPRVPYPKDQNTFWQLVKLGGELRQIHLLESLEVEKYITQYPIDGNNVVTKPKYENGKVYINETQYFDNVPEEAWNFYIGGYQPAQKWLKDRKERILEFEDILHYQKIIVALCETDRLMKKIDEIAIE